MERLFTFLQTYRGGILLLLFALAGIAFLVQWFAWIFAKGRFRPRGTGGTGTGTGAGIDSGKAVSFIFSEAAVKIINEFRHLLALLIVMIFAFALGYSLIKAASLPTGASMPSTIDNMKEALQGVVATLGGLVGSIIGYYFGESSITKGSPSTSDAGSGQPSVEVQKPPSDGKPGEERKAPAPPDPTLPGAPAGSGGSTGSAAPAGPAATTGG